MVRDIAAVVLGYVTIFVVLFLTFMGLYAALGAERVFRPGSYEVSHLWAMASLVVSLVAAAVGGMVAGLIARSDRPIWVFAGLLVVLGVLSALAQNAKPLPAGARPADLSGLAAMQENRTPLLLGLAMPVIGAV